MRTLINNYTFDKTTKQITFTDFVTISIEHVFLVVVVSGTNAGLTIYQANDINKGGTVSGNVLTLEYDTTGPGFSNTDKLQIFYEVSEASVVIPVSDNGSSLTVDGTVSITAIPAGNNNIGDVDVASVPAPLNITGSGTGASSLRVQLSDESLSALENTNVTVTAGEIEIKNDSGNPVPVTGTINANITASISEADVFKTSMVGSRYNQIEINFEEPVDNNLITNTTLSTGSVSIANGHTLYSTGASPSAYARGISVQKTDYRPGHEIYTCFTAAFTPPPPSCTNSYQRIGLYDANNGFFIGFESLTFGITKRTNSVDTFVAASSFNKDLLNGGLNSKFTRNGVPEAINLAYSNLFRIRFGWLGSASIIFEVYSPDGDWVAFHVIKQPNLGLNPSIYNPNLPMTIDVIKTLADTTVLTMYTACWAAGTTSDLDKITATLTDYSLAALSRSVITGRTTAGGSAYVNVKVTPSGSLTTAIGDITGIVGQNTMANSVPVVIASNQTAVPASQSGTWNINNITGTVSLPTGAATSAKQPALGTAGTPSTDVITVQGITSMTALKVDGSAVTQPISGSVSVSNFPATQNVSVTSSVEVEVKNDVGNPIPISGTVTANAGTGSFTVAQATAANLNATVAQSGTWNINNITGTVSLPTGAATETTLNAINTKTPALGQALMANSTPVVIASNQIVSTSDSKLNTYGVGVTDLIPATGATDIFTITGSATKIIKVHKIHISAITTGNGAQLDLFLIKRSSPDTGGTSTTPTVVPFDSINPAGTAVIRSYTANPTLGTAVGTLSQSMLFVSTTNKGADNYVQGNNFVALEFGANGTQFPTLRGVNEQLCINLAGVASLAGWNFEIDCVWTEE